MANRFFNPNQQFNDGTGLPYAGGSLAFYASGTSTPLSTYSDSALAIPNANPVVLDSAGRAGNIFLQNLAYKVVLADVNSNVIWTEDPVFASDFSTRAKFLAGNGSPNGNLAGTAGSAGIGADSYWDYTNNILYVCTTTGNAVSAIWTAVNATTAAAIVVQPQGYLTLTTQTPIIPTDVTAATSVFYTPYTGNLVPIYNGASFITLAFTELTLTLNAAHAASNIYDVFVFNNSGVPTLVTGPSWSAGTSGSITAGSCARGTGAGGATLARINGILTNAVQITGRNGATTYTINANFATYVGSIFMDGTNGQITCHRSYGQSRKWGVWNAFNRAPIYLKAGDSTASWAVAGTTFAAVHALTTNSLTVFSGLPEESYDLRGVGYGVGSTSGTGTMQYLVGIGFNSTSSSSGFAQGSGLTMSTSLNFGAQSMGSAAYLAPPSIGINTVTFLEKYTQVSMTASGTESSNLLSALWLG